MQHLDEGTVHSWLDGALSGDEAARVEGHVKECPQCAAAVAEARGFIAASSRILTALDNVPRGVVPAAAPKKRVDPLVWRVAAMVLVVAVGTLVVFRNGVSPVRVDNAPAPVRPDTSSQAEDMRATAQSGSQIAFIAKPTQKPPTRTESIARVSAKRGDGTSAAMAGEKSAMSENRPVTASAPPFAQSLVIGATAVDAAREPPLTEVGHPRTFGARVTLYEVAPGDTVTLTEPMASQLTDVVTTGAATESQQQSAEKSRAAAPARRADAAAISAANSQLAPRAVSAPESVEAVNGVTTIRWMDPVTRNVLSLSGRMSAARLQEIRLRIERERAAAAAKKNP
jgi:putative zinc finger protein